MSVNDYRFEEARQCSDLRIVAGGSGLNAAKLAQVYALLCLMIPALRKYTKIFIPMQHFFFPLFCKIELNFKTGGKLKTFINVNFFYVSFIHLLVDHQKLHCVKKYNMLWLRRQRSKRRPTYRDVGGIGNQCLFPSSSLSAYRRGCKYYHRFKQVGVSLYLYHYTFKYYILY